MHLGTRSSKAYWDHVFLSSTESHQQGLLRFSQTPQYRYLLNALYDHYGSLVGLRSIEIGAGLGKASALLSLHGVKPTLVDYSEHAIECARRLFESISQGADFFCADALQLPESLSHAFDVSISVGTAEHFSGTERLKFIGTHSLSLRPGGIGMVVVPNSMCLRYNVLMNLSSLFGLALEKEYPFTRGELARLAKCSGFSDIVVIGMNRQEAKDRFRWYDLLRDATNVYHPWLGRAFRRCKGLVAPTSEAPIDSGIEKSSIGRLPRQPQAVSTSWAENRFGYALIMKGVMK